MFFTAVYDTARLAPSVDTNRLQTSSRIGLLVCLPRVSDSLCAGVGLQVVRESVGVSHG